eukprot:2638148-Rhodomonas_salina.1
MTGKVAEEGRDEPRPAVRARKPTSPILFHAKSKTSTVVQCCSSVARSLRQLQTKGQCRASQATSHAMSERHDIGVPCTA